MYIGDPWCGFGLDVPGGRAMFAGARAVADPARLAAMRKDLPRHLVVGEMDPVNGQLAVVRELARRYEAAGLRDVTYPGARHEVFNEINRDEVVAGILAWLDREPPVRRLRRVAGGDQPGGRPGDRGPATLLTNIVI